MEVLFWTALLLTLYVYVGYPALVALCAAISPRPVRRESIQPPVTIVIAARNEAGTIASRIENLLALDYPREHIQIVVASDGSTDATNEILSRFGDRVDAVFLPPGGKARTLNAGVQAARHDILVFADARQRFASDALQALVAPFADPHVGAVCGELVLDCENDPTASTIGEGVSAYWRYEKWLRRHESAIWSTVGATGAIYALRRSFWKPLPDETILDDVLAPMRAALAGARVVFESGARAFDGTSRSDTEFARKTRTLAGNYQLIQLEPRLLSPFENPVWLQYVSHKLGRLMVPYALFALLLTSAVLAMSALFYAVVFVGQLGFYGLAAYGAVLDRRGRLGPALAAPMRPKSS
jgi:cellulose synthase/poly-beta-1,6-N-acetylglucosamine synthase-like glycosyltransferase